MSKRIQELAEQAEILFYKGRIPETGYEYEGAEVTKEDLQKFAGLIVRECAQLVQGVPADTMGYRTADQKIKDHFDIV